VSPGVVHLSYSVAILLSLTLDIWRALRNEWCKLRDVNGVQGCAVVMLLVGRAVNMRRVVIGGAKGLIDQSYARRPRGAALSFAPIDFFRDPNPTLASVHTTKRKKQHNYAL
jgi:hypothetical protein